MREPRAATTARFQVGVIGGGPGGLSAALWLARYLHSVVLMDSGDPRNWKTRQVLGYLGLPDVRPQQLRGIGRDTCENEGVTLRDARVLRIDRANDDGFVVCIAGGDRIVVDRVLLAIGIRDVWPDIPGLSRVFGANAHVCPDCDGPTTAGKKVVVLGNGRRAVSLALNLTTWTREIIICTNGRPDELTEPEYCQKLDALNIPVLTQRVVRVSYEGSRLTALELEDGMRLDADKLFFTLAQYPADDLGVQLGCARDEDGRILVDGHGKTSVRDVFAAGDITPGPQLAIRAAAEGAAAAIAIHKSLVPPSRKLRPRRPPIARSTSTPPEPPSGRARPRPARRARQHGA